MKRTKKTFTATDQQERSAMSGNKTRPGYTEEQLTNLSRAWSGVCEDCLCSNTPEQMNELEKLGLVEMRDAPDQWPEAQYGYVMTDKGEAVVKRHRENLKAS